MIGMIEAISDLCEWCGRPFRPRRGGSPQRFCGARCRTAFWSALRRWGERAVAAGILTIADIRNGDPAACTLLLAAGSPGAVDEAHGSQSTVTAPRVDSRHTTQQNLERLMAQAIAMRRR
jgi:hypothetical protein